MSDQRIAQLEDEVRSLHQELIDTLWEQLAYGDPMRDGDQMKYGHFFRSDLESAQDRLIELGAAERIDRYWVRRIEKQKDEA